MKSFAISVRLTATAALLLVLGFVTSIVENGVSCMVIFAVTAGAVIGSSLVVPRHKMVVALLTFGMGLILSVNLFTITLDSMYRAVPSLFYVSIRWKESACGVIGSVIGLIVTRRIAN